jgi:hypothetical protein
MLLDASAFDMMQDKVARAIAATKPDLIGIEGICTDFAFLLDALYVIRHYASSVPVLMGESIVTYDQEFIHSTFKPDYSLTENVMEEIKYLYERYPFNILIVLDELFAVNKQKLEEFCRILIDYRERHGWDFDWLFQTHANARLNLESLQLANRAGCIYFSYRLEVRVRACSRA